LPSGFVSTCHWFDLFLKDQWMLMFAACMIAEKAKPGEPSLKKLDE
jgi:hypothetical protein